VGDVAASAEAASLRVHHSFVELPDAGFRPRFDDPRAATSRSATRSARRRLEEPLVRRTDPAATGSRRPIRRAKLSAVKKPIVYYLDPGTPEPIRSALLEGARWWTQAFEAAGFKDRVPRRAAARRREPARRALQRHQLGAPLDARLEHRRRDLRPAARARSSRASSRSARCACGRTT
jgi:hypothetical protein